MSALLLLLVLQQAAVPEPLPEALPEGAPTTPGAPHAPRAPVLKRLAADPAHLAASLRSASARAAEEGARVLVVYGAAWCTPCRALEAAFARERNRAVLATWRLVEVDVDRLPAGQGPPGGVLPRLVRLDARGGEEAVMQGRDLGDVDDADALDAALARFLRLRHPDRRARLTGG